MTYRLNLLFGLLMLVVCQASESPDQSFAQVQPILTKYCQECHQPDRAEAEIDLKQFGSMNDVRKHPKVWLKVRDMVASGQMPPKDARSITDAEREQLLGWLRAYLSEEAKRTAGDPGKVVLRRLNNAEYTYTIQELTGISTLDPAREFPADGAAGEGFTNTGNALAMSPSLVNKYLDAGKYVAEHVVLLPDGARFSPHRSRRDWTEEALKQIRDFYAQFADAQGGTAVDLQGVRFETNQGGRLPAQLYLRTLLEQRSALRGKSLTIADLARQKKLSDKYLSLLWTMLEAKPTGDSILLDELRRLWAPAKPGDEVKLNALITSWQQSLWKFNSVGHIGKQFGRTDGPQSWQEPINPINTSLPVRFRINPLAEARDITLYLTSIDLAANQAGTQVVWENPRFVQVGKSELALRDVQSLTSKVLAEQSAFVADTQQCLQALAEVDPSTDLVALAKKHQVQASHLSGWVEYLGLKSGTYQVNNYLSQKGEKMAGHDFVNGWVGADALSVVANSSNMHVRIPGNLNGRTLAVHPAPNRRVLIGWRCPETLTAKLRMMAQHAHPECGNGVEWSLEIRRGQSTIKLNTGVAHGPQRHEIELKNETKLQKDDLLTLVIAPRGNDHSCDLTMVDLSITTGNKKWNLADDCAGNLLAANPHPDQFGNKQTWHFFSEPTDTSTSGVPADSLIARWQSAATPQAKTDLAKQLHGAMEQFWGKAIDKSVALSPADRQLLEQLQSFDGPLVRGIRATTKSQTDTNSPASEFGLAQNQFGPRKDAQSATDLKPTDLLQTGTTVRAIKLPAALVRGFDFITTGRVLASSDPNDHASVQLAAGLTPTNDKTLTPALPLLAAPDSAAKQRIERSLDEFRNLFPLALCYTKIVPVDEVVTLTLYYREDDFLKQLMLNDQQAQHLDRLWRELFYIAQEPFQLANAYEQLVEYTTQDRQDMTSVFGRFKPTVVKRTEEFRQDLIKHEPIQLAWLIGLMDRIYRRPVANAERAQVQKLYQQLRRESIPHDEAFRLILAKMLVSPSFLYRLEAAPSSKEAKPVTNIELANRLSYFLWSSPPDKQLIEVATSGRLTSDAELRQQLERMRRDPKVMRFAREFGTQWLHIYQFDLHDEKSETLFPTFGHLKGDMHEESVRFIANLLLENRPVTDLLSCDYTFLNESLAKHYGIPNVTGAHWRKVTGVSPFGRGGILAHASVLSKQAGASRTSPILRGNWLSEVVLGEKLPRPPKNVPQLAETAPAGLTERQLIEKHSRDPACMKCHARIDPYGFALEEYDAIGKLRKVDAHGLTIDSKASLPDGTQLGGLTGLQKYLNTTRQKAFVRQFNRKLLGYALGRAVQLSDEPLLDELDAKLASSNYSMMSAIELIVLSKQFREIRGSAFPDDSE